MYITETTENVKKIIEKIEQLNDVGKVKIVLYTFGLLNNDQINSKNESNPNLVEDDELVVFNMPMLGLSNNACEIFLQYNLILYNGLTNVKNVYMDNGNVIGMEYDEIELEIIQCFEKLTYNEKLDLFKELFIRYDNNTYFREKINIISFDSNLSGFDIARLIDNYKI